MEPRRSERIREAAEHRERLERRRELREKLENDRVSVYWMDSEGRRFCAFLKRSEYETWPEQFKSLGDPRSIPKRVDLC